MVNISRKWPIRLCLALALPTTVVSAALPQTLEGNPDSLLAALDEVPGSQELDDALETMEHARPTLMSWSSTATRSAGKAPRFRTRLDLRGTTLVVRIDAEQDPSEPWLLRPAGGQWGFDHVGAFAEWQPTRQWDLILGDFRLAHGLGLAASPPRLGRAADDAFGVSRTGRISAGSPAARPYAGSDEDRYLSGVAVTRLWNPLRITVFRSFRHLDAAPDSIRLEDGSRQTAVRLRPAQDHATALGAGRRRGLGLSSTGGHVAVSVPSFEISAMVFTEGSRLDLLPASRLSADPFRSRLNVSISTRAQTGRFSWSGEASWVGLDHSGAAFLRFQDRAVSLLAGWRRFAPRYAPLWASAPSFRSGVPGNEIGYTTAVQWRPDSGGPFRLVFDRGCRIRAEADYSRAGCRDSARIDARWSPGGWAIDAITTWDRLREPDSAGKRGPERERILFSAVARCEPADGVALTVSASLRRVDIAVAPGFSGNDMSGRWSSKVAARIRWEITPRMVMQSGLADFHVAESVMGLFQAGLPLMSSIGTLSGDGSSVFLTMTRAGSRLDWGATLARSRSQPIRPDAPKQGEIDLKVGLHVRIKWPGGPGMGT